MKSPKCRVQLRFGGVFNLVRLRKFTHRNLRRRIVCVALVLSLLILPGPGLALNELPALASDATCVTVGSFRYLPLVIKNLFGMFSSAKPRPQNLDERIASVRELRVSPHKLVGYVGDRVTFAGMGVDGDGQLAHGARVEWASSDTSIIEIDEAGRATLLRPGLVRVTCRAGSASRSAPVLIRPTRRRLQTDQEWRADQDSLSETAAGPTGFIEALPSLLDKLVPTAHAQGNSPGDYGNAAPVGQVGTPPLTALEETRLGPVMPGTNFELPISLVSLGGRGLATSLTAYYNSNQWGAYVGPGGTTFVFDPIQSWPSPGRKTA